jgi:hypothetical protein
MTDIAVGCLPEYLGLHSFLLLIFIGVAVYDLYNLYQINKEEIVSNSKPQYRFLSFYALLLLLCKKAIISFCS